MTAWFDSNGGRHVPGWVGSFFPSHEETFHPEFLAGLVVAFVAAGAYWYGGWRWGVVGLLAAALVALRIRAAWTGPSPSPAENERD